MEKYAVVLDDEKTKTAGQGRSCPGCGTQISGSHCPNCGTKPFEKRPGGTLGGQEGEERGSGSTPTDS